MISRAEPAGPDPGPSACLGVGRSLKGNRWVERPADPRLALALSQQAGVPEVVGRLMAARHVGLADAAVHLDPTLKATMPDPSVVVDMDRAADRIAAVVTAGGRLGLLADYDVDGATSAALVLRWAAALGVPCGLHVPDRIAEGYGPNLAALRRLRDEGADLILTVDCGTTAFAPLAAAAEAGIPVVVLDHHAAEPLLPEAVAIVNPNRLDQPAGPGRALGTLAACGVTFLTLVAVNRALRRAGFFTGGRTEPDLRGLLDLVALGTVADVVPLTGLNRAFVAQGMRVMARRTNPGLVALCDVAKIAKKLDAWHLGWTLGPRVNAGGRIGRADLGARLLASDDALDCARLASLLDGHNEDRKAIEAAVLADAIAQVERAGGQDGVLLVAGTGWHPGVIGIVAGRLKERFRRPACVVALEGGVGKASGRSVAGFDLGGAVVAARHAGLLMSGGGHPMAAGFTVAEGKLADLAAFFRDHVRRVHLDGVLPHDAVPLLEVDCTLAASGATMELATLVGKLGPFGPANPEPRFVLPSMVVRHAKEVGQGGHVAVRIEGPGGAALRGIAFRAAGEPLGRALMDRAGAVLHLAGTLRLDEWAGRESLQFHIDDAAPAW